MTIESEFSLLTASLTPLDQNLNLDYDLLKAHIQDLLQCGASGIVLFGTTGEGNSLSVSERKHGLEAILDGGISPNKLIVGTGCCALTDTVDLTQHALNAGVDRVLVLPPFYYKNVSNDGLFSVFDYLLQHLGHSKVKVYLYHFPQMCGVPISIDLVQKLIVAYPDNICGFKDSSGDWGSISAMIQGFPQLQVFAGSEEFLLDTLRLGGAGCISATTNVTLPLAVELLSNFKTSGANELQRHLSQLRHSLEQWPMIAALKVLMQHLKGEDQWENIRPPLSVLSSQDAQACIQSYETAAHQAMMNLTQ